MNNNIGTITRVNNFLRVDNALVEEVSLQNQSTGSLLISHSNPLPNGRSRIDLLRLNVNRNTIVLNERRFPMCFCDIREGMWIDSLFSPAMTRSVPPQSNAFVITVQRTPRTPLQVMQGRIARVDARNNFFVVGNPNNVNSQTRFVVGNETTIHNRNGNQIPLVSLRPGQMVRVTHPNFQTASIPPQTTALHVQIL